MMDKKEEKSYFLQISAVQLIKTYPYFFCEHLCYQKIFSNMSYEGINDRLVRIQVFCDLFAWLEFQSFLKHRANSQSIWHLDFDYLEKFEFYHWFCRLIYTLFSLTYVNFRISFQNTILFALPFY